MINLEEFTSYEDVPKKVSRKLDTYTRSILDGRKENTLVIKRQVGRNKVEFFSIENHNGLIKFADTYEQAQKFIDDKLREYEGGM